MQVVHGEGFCDGCEQDKALVMLVSLSSSVGICSDCLPTVIDGLNSKFQELMDKQTKRARDLFL